MNNKNKAKQITDGTKANPHNYNGMFVGHIVRSFVFDKVMEMATWKDEQLKKKLDEIIEIGESNYARGNKIDMLKELLNLR